MDDHFLTLLSDEQMSKKVRVVHQPVRNAKEIVESQIVKIHMLVAMCVGCFVRSLNFFGCFWCVSTVARWWLIKDLSCSPPQIGEDSAPSFNAHILGFV